MGDMSSELRASLPPGSASDSDIAAVQEAAGKRLPLDFVALLKNHGGAEGWIAGTYVALWPASKIVEYNRALDSSIYAPGLLLFGTDGGDEAFALDMSNGYWVVVVPLVGMSRDVVVPLAPTVTDWLSAIADDVRRSPPRRQVRPRMNLFHKQPLILGGSPDDRANIVWVELEQAIDLARWWNVRLAELRGVRHHQ